MKKKYTASLLIIATIGLLAACGNDNDTSVLAMNATPIPTEVSTVEETATTEITTVEETTTETETEADTQTETQGEKETNINNETSDFIYTVTPISQTMYTQKGCNVREKPSTDYEVIVYLDKATEVNVTGKVNEVNWYEVSINDERGYISASLLSTEKIVDNTNANNTNTSDNNPQTPAETPSTPSTQPSVITNPPDENGRYIDENGGEHYINPATGDYYKDGDTNSQGWTYGSIF